jgi:hypothetical protein
MALLQAPFVSGGYCPGTRTPSSADQARQYSFIAFGLRCRATGVRPSLNHVGAAGLIPRIHDSVRSCVVRGLESALVVGTQPLQLLGIQTHAE